MTKISITFIFLILFSTVVSAQNETVPAAQSDLTGVTLPSGAMRVVEGSIPAEINQSLDKLVAAGEGKIRSGEREVLAWTNNFKKAGAPALIKKFTDGLEASGWAYELGGSDGELAIFSLTRQTPEKRALLGFYTYSNDAFVLAWTEIVATGSQIPAKPAVSGVSARDNSAPGGARVVNIPKGVKFGNVMGNEMPAMPKFPPLSPKPGRVRGYVKDASGKPLAGAAIGVRSTLIGGAYSGAQGKTDANGYYEFVIPRGAAHYYNAGYAIDYGDGLAAIGLHPADGSIDSFASVDGAVENFVMLSYGVTSRANVSENPRLPATYYGGALFVNVWVVEASEANIYPTSIVENEVVEITLMPDGPLADGSTGSSFVVHKTIGFEGGFWINNIPVGRYKVSAKLAGGRSLKMKSNDATGTVFGMSPRETTSGATILFRPSGAQASMAGVGYGSWQAVDFTVSK